MAFVTVKFDEAKLASTRNALRNIKGALPTVMSRGINRTLATTRAETVRRLKAEIKLPAEIVRRRIKIYKASRKKWRGKVWIGGANIPLAKFGARQSTRTHLVTASARQSLWLYYNIFRVKFGHSAKFSWRYRIKRRVPKVTYDTGQGRKKLEQAFVIEYKTGHKAVKMLKGATPALPLIKANNDQVFVINEKLIEQAKATIISLTDFAGRTLVKNVDEQVELALKTG